MRLLLLAALALTGCSAEAGQAVKPRPSQSVRVIDGDTLEVAGEKVRISNIDAPELPPHAKCWAEAGLAISAAQRLQEYVNVAPTLSLRREGRDRYGRTLARVVDRDSDFGEALIAAGVAARWTGRRWDWCSPAQFSDPNGPDLISGPEGNRPYMEWATRRQVQAAVSADPWSTRAPSRDQATRAAP